MRIVDMTTIKMLKLDNEKKIVMDLDKIMCLFLFANKFAVKFLQQILFQSTCILDTF